MANAENFIGEGDRIWLDLIANSSGGDIEPGDMCFIPSIRTNAKNTATITSCTGITSSSYFIGVSDSYLTAGERGLYICTKGVFEFNTISNLADITGKIGDPMLAQDAKIVTSLYKSTNGTGLPSIGNVVRLGNWNALSANTSRTVWVRINPPMLRNWINSGSPTAVTASHPNSYPTAATGIICSGT